MATKSIAWNTGTGNIILTYQGQGDGPISIQSDANNLGSARGQVITVETVGGAITRGFTVNQAGCPVPVGTVLNYAYTGSYQEVTLPAGQYKLQCWGAQGGSNAAASSYSITAKAGGKGGYSEGIITLSTKTTVRVYVGGQGSSSAGGFNGGGSTTGTSQYSTGTSGQAGYTFGYSKIGGGGGATDIRLSDGALLSRFIVAGGGSGGAMCYNKTTTSTTSWTSFASGTVQSSSAQWVNFQSGYWFCTSPNMYLTAGKTYRVKINYTETSDTYAQYRYIWFKGATVANAAEHFSKNTWHTFTFSSNYEYACARVDGDNTRKPPTFTYTIEEQTTSTSTSTSTDYQVGGVGGGTQGGGYSSTYAGKQNAAGSGGAFGQGANQTTTNYRYCSGAGGGGWYGGGGGQKSDSSMTYCKYSGGGSGFVNTAASAGNRPSGYIGLELDSGETKAGNTSFPSTSGGTETGHSGNGYAKITRIA